MTHEEHQPTSRVVELNPQIIEKLCQKMTFTRFVATKDKIFVAPQDLYNHQDMFEPAGIQPEEIVDAGFMVFFPDKIYANETSSYLHVRQYRTDTQQLAERANTLARIRSMVGDKILVATTNK